MIVVDTNVLMYFFFPSPFGNQIDQLQQADGDWAAPVLWRSEFLNACTGMLRNKLITVADINAAFDQADQAVMTFGALFEPSSITTHIASSSCSSYDCEFVSMADILEVKLITYDKKIHTEFPDIAMTPEQFLKLPK